MRIVIVVADCPVQYRSGTPDLIRQTLQGALSFLFEGESGDFRPVVLLWSGDTLGGVHEGGGGVPGDIADVHGDLDAFAQDSGVHIVELAIQHVAQQPGGGHLRLFEHVACGKEPVGGHCGGVHELPFVPVAFKRPLVHIAFGDIERGPRIVGVVIPGAEQLRHLVRVAPVFHPEPVGQFGMIGHSLPSSGGLSRSRISSSVMFCSRISVICRMRWICSWS